MPERRFPPPWLIAELEACFVVRDHGGQALAYVYFEEKLSLADDFGSASDDPQRSAADRGQCREAAGAIKLAPRVPNQWRRPRRGRVRTR